MAVNAQVHAAPRWRGGWLVAVAVIHTALVGAVFAPQFAALAREGVVNAVGTDAQGGLAVWCALFGLLLLVLGLTIHACERACPGPLPRVLGWSLLGLTAVGVVLMPASGFWLALPPAISLLRGRAAAPSAPAAP